MIEIDGDDVDAGELRHFWIFLQEVLADFGDDGEFLRRDGFFGKAKQARFSGFDFDKDGGDFIDENKIDFAKRRAEVAGEKFEALTFEKLSCQFFGLRPEKEFWGHG